MGFFGWIGRKAKALANTLCDAVSATGRAISNGYKTFTGQATFEEADRMYDEVMQRSEAHKKYFEKQVDKLSSEIETHVQSINVSKETIKTELFPAFSKKMRSLKDIPVTDEYLKEYFSGTTIKVDSMKTKADLYLIDFKKNPFKSNALAIITLGF